MTQKMYLRKLEMFDNKGFVFPKALSTIENMSFECVVMIAGEGYSRFRCLYDNIGKINQMRIYFRNTPSLIDQMVKHQLY